MAFRELINEVVNSETGILITTYEHLRRQHADLLDVRYQSRHVHSSLLSTPMTVSYAS